MANDNSHVNPGRTEDLMRKGIFDTFMKIMNF